MSVAPSNAERLDSAVTLSFSHTVDRSAIHRRNLTEVFLTDARSLDDGRFAAAALLPLVHPHYTSLSGRTAGTLDLLLLLECCRQAETYAAHAFFDVESDASFVLRDWSVELTAGHVDAATSGPTELVMTATTANQRVSGGRTRSLDYDFELWVAGERIGRVLMAVGYVPQRGYAVIRARGRSGPPPRSDQMAGTNGGTPVEPARVGRLYPTDTVLLDAVTAGDEVAATLRVPAENPSLFDHPQDHVPGMVLLEAARQIATLATAEWGGGEPHETTLVEVSSSFSAYAELDAPITVTACRPADSGPAGPGRVDVTFHQSGADIARMTLGLATVSAAPPGDE